jgi:hypothetical protein
VRVAQGFHICFNWAAVLRKSTVLKGLCLFSCGSFFSLANVQSLALKDKEQEHAGLLESASEMKVLCMRMSMNTVCTN